MLPIRHPPNFHQFPVQTAFQKLNKNRNISHDHSGIVFGFAYNFENQFFIIKYPFPSTISQKVLEILSDWYLFSIDVLSPASAAVKKNNSLSLKEEK